jgi:hypothetical protein
LGGEGFFELLTPFVRDGISHECRPKPRPSKPGRGTGFGGDVQGGRPADASIALHASKGRGFLYAG